MNKKILTLEDLENFYAKQNRNISFSSKESGYQLAVQIPSKFEIETNTEDNSLFYGLIKCFHIGTNRNHSSVTEDAAKKAMKTMAYKPILAGFTSWVDENGNTIEDFTSHDMEVDEDGNVVYLERQIGCFTADEPYIEHDDELDKDFIFARCAIPREYTSAVSIIERKGYTKVSVELIVNELSYNASEKVLELTDVVVQGLTCLGTNPETGQAVEEGMKGSRLDIEDFSKSNNSLFSSITEETRDTKLIETLEKLNVTLSNLNINQAEISAEENSKEGGNETGMTKYEELKTKYNKTDEDITFEVEGLTDEELEAKFAEVFGEVESGVEPTSDDEGDVKSDKENPEDNTSEADESGTDEEPTSEDEAVKDNSEDNEESETPEVKETEACGGSKKKKHSIESEDGRKIEFEVSYDEIENALWNLVNDMYAESDNCWYGVRVYESYCVMQDYCSGRTYKQSYTNEDGTISLSGDRVEVYVNYLTKEEENELETMRQNYSAISEKLSAYESAELKSQKDAVLSDEAYAEFVGTDEFKEIIGNIDNYSVDELKNACDLAFAKLVKANRSFSLKSEPVTEKKANKLSFAINSEEEYEPYGDYFKSVN